MDSQQIIELIRKEKYSEVLDVLYDNYPAFKKTLLKSGGTQKDAEDIFQDALLVFIEKVADTNFVLNCAVNTYLFSICRNLSLVYFKRKSKNIILPLEEEFDYCDESEVEAFLEREQQFSALDEVLKTAGKKCLELLTLFYVKNMKMSEIAKRLRLKGESSAKTQKYKCLEKAKQMAFPILAAIEKKAL